MSLLERGKKSAPNELPLFGILILVTIILILFNFLLSIIRK